MSEAQLAPVLSKATAEVLEKMFFAEVVQESAGRPHDGADPIGVTLTFQGERRGTLAVAISPSAARQLAADFLGVEAEDGGGQAQVEEVARELANMICGDALSALEQSPLQIASPRIVACADFVLSGRACSRSFDLGNGWLTVTLDMEDADA